MPVTCTVSSCVGLAWDWGWGAGDDVEASCANAGLMTRTPPTNVNMALEVNFASVRLMNEPSGLGYDGK
ncbi:hypothetical protein D3C81_2299030 [compost metagenome]